MTSNEQTLKESRISNEITLKHREFTSNEQTSKESRISNEQTLK